MFLSARVRAHPEFKVGARNMAPIAPGIAAWGLMTGVAMVNSGMSVIEALAMSLFVFAGSSQLASIPLIAAGAPMWVILATGFCVNLRFVVFSAHLRPYLVHQPLVQRLVNGYLTADLSYAQFVRRFPAVARSDAEREAQQAFLAGNCAVNWSSWVGASIVGVVMSGWIPMRWGLGFAGILALVGVLCSLATSRLRVVAMGVAGAAAVAAYALPLKLNILVAIAAAVAVCLMLEHTPLRDPEPAEPEGDRS